MSCNDFMGHFAAGLTIDDPFNVYNAHSCHLIEIMIDHWLEDDTKGKKILIEEECGNNRLRKSDASVNYRCANEL